MTYCTNCGKKVTLLKRIPLAYIATGAAALVAGLIGPKDMPLLDRIYLVLPKGPIGDSSRPANIQVDIDTEAGVVWYCSEKCRDSDLRRCDWCQKYFSLKKTGMIEGDSASLICPNCSRKAEEVEQTHQKLVATMRSDEELTLLSYAEQHPEDSSGYLQLAYYYLDYGKKWQEYLSTREADLLYKLVEDRLLRWGYYEIQPYHRAVETAFELASENLRKAVALGLDSLEEGKAHYWIAYMLRHAPQKHSISDPDRPSLDFYPTQAELKQVEKDANAALRASVKAINTTTALCLKVSF
jgi:hypothetical protein